MFDRVTRVAIAIIAVRVVSARLGPVLIGERHTNTDSNGDDQQDTNEGADELRKPGESEKYGQVCQGILPRVAPLNDGERTYHLLRPAVPGLFLLQPVGTPSVVGEVCVAAGSILACHT